MVQVRDRLPSQQQDVLGYTLDGEFVVARFIPEPGDEARAKRDGHIHGITHWGELPWDEVPRSWEIT